MRGVKFILCPFSHFEMQEFKNSKHFACSALIFNIHIFGLMVDAGVQVDIDFNTEAKFSCSRSSFFSPLSDHSKPTKTHETAVFFIHLVGLEGPPNHPVCKARTFCVNVNKHESY